MLFADLPVQVSGKTLAKSFAGGKAVVRDLRKVTNGSGKLVSVPRAAHPLPVEDSGADFIGPVDLRPFMVRKFKAGKAKNSDYLTRKRGGAVGMVEGWREIAETPIRQRVGLAGMAYDVEAK